MRCNNKGIFDHLALHTDVPNILSSLAAQSYFSKDPNLCCQESSDEPLSKVISDAFTLLSDTEG